MTRLVCFSSELDDLIVANMRRDDAGQWFCLQCTFGSRKVSHMKTHIESKHVETGGFVCPTCSKVSATRESLRKHIARLHWTNRSSNTRNHIEAKHIQSGGFQCSLCNAFSPTRHALKMHMLRKHRKDWNWVVIFSPEWCHKSEDLQDWRWLIQLLWVWLLLEVQDNVPRPRRESPYFHCWVHLSLLPKILPYKKCSKITHFQKS